MVNRINMKLTIDNHEHRYMLNKQDQDECVDCGLLKSTIEFTQPKPTSTDCKHEWTYLGKDDSWKYCKNCRTPFKPTPNSLEDWEKELELYLPKDLVLNGLNIKSFITQALAKAQEEEKQRIIKLVEGMQILEPVEDVQRLDRVNAYLAGQMNMLLRFQDILTTLKE